MDARESFEQWYRTRGGLYPMTMKAGLWLVFKDAWDRALKSVSAKS